MKFIRRGNDQRNAIDDGEGLTDTPINRRNRGEVQNPSPICP